MPDRHGPLKVPMGRFIDSVNGGTVGNGAVVVPLGSDPWTQVGQSVNGYAIEDRDASFTTVVPEGARGGEGISPEDVMLLGHSGEALGRPITYDVAEPGAFVYGGVPWFPRENWLAPEDATWSPGSEWIPPTTWIPDDPESIGVLVPNAEATMERMGMDGLPEGAERVEQGDTVEAETLVVATFGDPELYPDGNITDSSGSPFLPEEPIFPDETLFSDSSGSPFAPALFDAGTQAPISGAGFGMGALSTPSASVGEEDLNPIIPLSTSELLTREETSSMLSDAGISDTQGFVWLAGPESASAEVDYETPTLLGETAELELFTGVVSGTDAPWGVTLGVARATPDDHVIAAGVNRRPVGTAEEGLAAVQDDQHVIDNMAGMLAETVPELESG